jgi:succinyldiaminopimelate transaminase
VTGLTLGSVLPVVGSKELIASLAGHLGIGAGDLVAYPELAYPTYEVGAVLAGARAVARDALTSFGPEVPALLWINSPSNPTGRVLPPDHLRKVVDWCRERGTLLVSDECYLECAWEAEPVSVLHPDICGGSHEGILAVHSLSKRSNLAGYRCAFVAGDPAVVGELLAVRKNLGLQMPGPQQVAMAAALADDAHVVEQHARYAARRAKLREALLGAGFEIDHSEASLYLWARRVVDGVDQDCWDTVSWLADRGILVAPGSFYGTAGVRHVRVALTATDERIAAAVERLSAG